MFINLSPHNTRLKSNSAACFAVMYGSGAWPGWVQSHALWCRRECRQAAARIAARWKIDANLCMHCSRWSAKIASSCSNWKLARNNSVELQPTDHFIDLLGVLGTAAQANPGKVHVQRLTVQAGQATAQPVPARGAPAASPAGSPLIVSTLSLNGLADDDAALAQFVTALRQSGVFERVELRSSSQVAADSTRQYQLECRYEELP